MNNDLSFLQSELARMADVRVELRGSGKAEFLYLRSPGHAMEVCLDDDGTYALEYWDTADETSDEALVRSENVQSQAEVIANVTKWFQGGG
jgi:hypothetical protein